jgi:hypothetical protein
MTEYIVKRTGKLLFPHLPRDQRKSHLSILTLVLTVTLIGAGIMAKLMVSTGKF